MIVEQTNTHLCCRIAEKDEELRKKEEEIAQLRERLGDVEQTVVVPTESQAEFEEKYVSPPV